MPTAVPNATGDVKRFLQLEASSAEQKSMNCLRNGGKSVKDHQISRDMLTGKEGLRGQNSFTRSVREETIVAGCFQGKDIDSVQVVITRQRRKSSKPLLDES